MVVATGQDTVVSRQVLTRRADATAGKPKTPLTKLPRWGPDAQPGL